MRKRKRGRNAPRAYLPAPTTITEVPAEEIAERRAEVELLLCRVRAWAARRSDILAVGLAGSWARDEARADSDVDLTVITTDPRCYLEYEAWVGDLGGSGVTQTRAWGPLTERRFSLASGLEVEAGFASLSWAATDPIDPGTRGVVRDGFRVLYDPEGSLARLHEACR